ncbi:MAG: DUF423 domain-containing protein [Spongiibacteraceae bacterium]|jgi:uncharacterized membrane protein YgdD (TMEM256/DUF423 family)|nr:DUF423 domain-containing protein [Spongiibacteraceae bacterium]
MRLFLMLAALSGFLAVGLGAFGAHGLKARVSAELLAVYQTGVLYHLVHTLALLGVAVLMYQIPASTLLKISGWAFVAGILVFSGSLYLLTFTGVRWLGAITPLGGLCLLTGWLLLAVAAWRDWPGASL